MNNNNLIIIPCVAPENERRNGIIYCIYHNTNQGMFYIGSTFSTLRDRVSGHVSDSKRSNNKFYQYVNQFGWNNFSSFIYEEIKYVTDGELRYREGQYQLFYNSPLNSCIAGNNYNEFGQLLTDKEYRDKTKEHRSKHYKEWRESKGYVLCECGISYHESHRSDHFKSNKHLEYVGMNNIEICSCGGNYNRTHLHIHLKTKQHLEFIGNGDNFTSKQSEVIYCVCGGSYSNNRIDRHLETQKHKHYIYMQEVNNYMQQLSLNYISNQ